MDLITWTQSYLQDHFGLVMTNKQTNKHPGEPRASMLFTFEKVVFCKGTQREKDYKCLKMMRNMDKERSIEANDGNTVVLKKMARMDLL